MLEQIITSYTFISSYLCSPFQNLRIKSYNTAIVKQNPTIKMNEIKSKYLKFKKDIQKISADKCGRKMNYIFIDHSKRYNASICGNILYISDVWYKDIMQGKNLSYFQQTLGHELIHFKYHDICNPFCHHSSFESIKSILKEVRADIEGCKLMEISIDRAERSMLHIKNSSEEYHHSRYPSHPTWDNRIFYLKNYSFFNKELINKVIFDCHVESLTPKELQKIYDFFGL